MFGKGMVKCNEVNAHKKMAGAQMGGNFGVGKFPASGGAAKPKVGATGETFNRLGKL